MQASYDFKLFADLRLAGVGMIGVVHATNPIDAIQRFLGRVEMGVIPQIIDSVIFIKDGMVDTVLSLHMTVKVPAGMTEQDLARPVVVVDDFETGAAQYEIYSYGEQTVVIPVKNAAKEKKSVHSLAEGSIEAEFRQFSNNVVVEVNSDNSCKVFVPERDIAKIIGKAGKTIGSIEQKLGMKIDVLPLDEIKKKSTEPHQDVPFDIELKKGTVIFHLDITMQHKDVDINVEGEYLMTAKAGKTGQIKVKKNNPLGRELIKAVSQKKDISLLG